MGRTESPNLTTITSEPVVGKAISTRAKWRSSPSARIGMPKKLLDTADIVREAMLQQLRG